MVQENKPVKWEHYNNQMNDNSSSIPYSGETSSLQGKSGLESFAQPPKGGVDNSRADEGLKRNIRNSKTGVSGIFKVNETFVGDTSSILKHIEHQDEKPDGYDDDDDTGFFIIEAGEDDFLEK